MTQRDQDDPGKGGAEAIETGLTDLLGTLNAAVADMADRLTAGEAGGIRRSVEVNTRFGPIRAEAGFDVRFADRGPLQSGASEQGGGRDNASDGDQDDGSVRFVSCDVSEHGGAWSLSADLPGSGQRDLTLSVEGGRLIIATTGRRRYRAEVPFPSGRDVGDLVVQLDAGLLEMRLPPLSEGGS